METQKEFFLNIQNEQETQFLTANMTSMGNSEFVLTIFGALAQEESVNTSKRIKFIISNRHYKFFKSSQEERSFSLSARVFPVPDKRKKQIQRQRKRQ